MVYAFIDSQNLNLGTRSAGWRLDYQKFRVYLNHKFRVDKAFIFIGYIKQNRQLYEYLRNAGFELVFKKVVQLRSKQVKGNVDAELVLHSAKIQFPYYDKAVIVSGDGDFYCLLEELEKEGKLLALIIPNRMSESTLLKDFQKFKRFLDSESGRLQ